MPTDNELLIDILAATDAIFAPLRQADWKSENARSIFQRAQRFFSCGVHWTSGGTSAKRKASFNQIARLSAESRLELFPPHGLRLTDQAEWNARSLCGLPGLDASLKLVDRIEKAGGFRVEENTLARTEYGRPGVTEKLVAIEYQAAPALARGWLVAESNRSGHVAYSCHRSPAANRVGAELPASDPEMRKRYEAKFREFRHELRFAEPLDDRDIAPIPLPIGCVPKLYTVAITAPCGL